MLISVVMAVWNGERFVADAIASALAQTYAELELVVVDDGSTDATPAILDRFAAADPRLRVLRQANAGAAAARNAALAAASGDWAFNLDADDLMKDGLAPEEASLADRRRFGSMTTAPERHYEAGRILWLDRLGQDFRCAVRSLAMHPIASGVAVLSLAARIGSATASLAIRDAVLRHPPPLYQAPGQLSEVFTVTPL